MEELEILFKEIEEAFAYEVKFLAVYEPETGEILTVGPEHSLKNEPNIIEIDSETAENIISGTMAIHNCFVNLDTEELEITESRPAIKIDDVLFRIPNIKWTKIDHIDLVLSYYSKSNTLKIRLSEEYKGTKKTPKKYRPAAPKKVTWSGDAELCFLITEYNDPNVVFEKIVFSVNDLIGKTKIIKNITLPESHSFYTRRIFKNCVVEYK